MATGKVDFFNDTGGYGFIETDDADDDVFFHMEDVEGPDLEEGQERVRHRVLAQGTARVQRRSAVSRSDTVGRSG